MKICPLLPWSWHSYKLFKNYIMRLCVKSFILAKQDLSFALPGSPFAGRNFSCNRFDPPKRDEKVNSVCENPFFPIYEWVFRFPPVFFCFFRLIIIFSWKFFKWKIELNDTERQKMKSNLKKRAWCTGGTRTPGPWDPRQSLKVGPPSPSFNEFIFFRIFHPFFPYLFLCLF